LKKFRMKACDAFLVLLAANLANLAFGQFYNVSVREWDRDFKKNKWSFIDRVAVERARNSVITNIFYTLYGGGMGPKLSNLLDVGCGEGVLSDFLHGPQRQKYYGVDVSSEAIKSARKRRSQEGPPTDPYANPINPNQFQVSSAADYTPPSGVTFGAIVFNEMLYYTDYAKIIPKFASFLEPPSAPANAAAATAGAAASDRREKGTPVSAAGSDAGVAGGQGGIMIISVWFSEGNEKMRDEIFNEARKHLEPVDVMELSGVSRNGAGPKAVKRKVNFRIECFRRRV